MADDEDSIASGSPSAASSATQPLLPPQDPDDATSASHASGYEKVPGSPPGGRPGEQLMSAAADSEAHAHAGSTLPGGANGASAAGNAESPQWSAVADQPSQMHAAADPPQPPPEAAGGGGSGAQDTALRMHEDGRMQPLAYSNAFTEDVRAGFDGGDRAPYGGGPGAAKPAGGLGGLPGGHVGEIEGIAVSAGYSADSASLLSHRMSFYRQAWRYYGEHLSHKEFHPWAMLAVLLAGMSTLVWLSNGGIVGAIGSSAADVARHMAAARLQVTACCWVAGVVLSVLYFHMSRLQLTNRDFAVQCANASVVALQRTMHELRQACMRADAARGHAGGAADMRPGSPAGDGFTGNGHDSAAPAAAHAYGGGRGGRGRGGAPAEFRVNGRQYDVVWGEFVGKLQQSMRGGAAEYPVVLQRLLNWLGAVVCVVGLFGVSLPVEVVVRGWEQPAVNFVVAVTAVGLVWAWVHGG